MDPVRSPTKSTSVATRPSEADLLKKKKKVKTLKEKALKERRASKKGSANPPKLPTVPDPGTVVERRSLSTRRTPPPLSEPPIELLDSPPRDVLGSPIDIEGVHRHQDSDGKEYIRFTHRCPFAVLRIVQQPLPQRFTRMENYRAEPPNVMDPTMFHDTKSLAVYQGLIFQLLWLHSAYNRPYADPVHDPTWRWWKNKEQNAEYYFYVAGNRNSSGGVYVDMDQYVKVYKLKPRHMLPPQIYLDKKNTYTFSVFLSIRTAKQSLGETAAENSLDSIWLTVVLSHPKYFVAKLVRQELISRGSVLYEVRNGLSKSRIDRGSEAVLA
ncbi:UNVERIFIED_CONTAM: hypothetical protein K2H54_035623 [Gekko kuhli]